ncbi:hypothetical protein A2V54_02660 [candidate division WWE3 bacterium RBG_19FT_COMBO_53_11]|uniref:DUF11 domain-containing protein n=1 Tax=candidate division WWE3 bacterium RBG_19FT_COMBO_53_11 TaxID=1802613 RepID=A0A1F4UJ77_UNCKA|nr:MAG: hypothetical protein A2155_00730 [candidate division WWE3 bacterium RBG_16_52_45]OGC44977.1 MAG: hypothetical protein A2V54_02660 [candidate division WWE3 bacterium RBG_19FT_COMBO_53_11]
MIREVMKSWKVLFATILVTLGLVAAPLFNATSADIVVDGDLSVNKATAKRGDVLTYNFRVENNTGVQIGDILLVPGRQADGHAFSPYVDYVPGSTFWKDSLGGSGGPIDDTWVTLGGPDHPDKVLNVGKLNDGEWLEVTFQAEVKADAPNNALAESIVHFFPNADTAGIQCAAQTTVKVGEVLGAETLPDTGAADVLVISGYLVYLGVLLRKVKLYRYL